MHRNLSKAKYHEESMPINDYLLFTKKYIDTLIFLTTQTLLKSPSLILNTMFHGDTICNIGTLSCSEINTTTTGSVRTQYIFGQQLKELTY